MIVTLNKNVKKFILLNYSSWHWVFLGPEFMKVNKTYLHGEIDIQKSYYSNMIGGLMEGLWHSGGHTEGEVSAGEMPSFTEGLIFPASSASISQRLTTMYWPTQRKVKGRRYFSIFKKSNFYQKASDLKEENIKSCCQQHQNKIRGN